MRDLFKVSLVSTYYEKKWTAYSLQKTMDYDSFIERKFPLRRASSHSYKRELNIIQSASSQDVYNAEPGHGYIISPIDERLDERKGFDDYMTWMRKPEVKELYDHYLGKTWYAAGANEEVWVDTPDFPRLSKWITVGLTPYNDRNKDNHDRYYPNLGRQQLLHSLSLENIERIDVPPYEELKTIWVLGDYEWHQERMEPKQYWQYRWDHRDAYETVPAGPPHLV